jgi:hypothetical protein
MRPDEPIYARRKELNALATDIVRRRWGRYPNRHGQDWVALHWSNSHIHYYCVSSGGYGSIGKQPHEPCKVSQVDIQVDVDVEWAAL